MGIIRKILVNKRTDQLSITFSKKMLKRLKVLKEGKPKRINIEKFSLEYDE